MRFVIITCLTFLLSFPWSGFSGTSDSKTGVISIDGLTSDFDKEQDQILLSPDLTGVNRESDSDSVWGTGNELISLKLTWDRQYLYIGVDGTCSGNNIILYIDSGSGKGISDVSGLNAWKRKFTFQGMAADFFWATWDGNKTPQFWQIINNTSDNDISPQVISASTIQGNLKGGMEIRIPWNSIYGRGDFSVATDAVLKIAGVVTGGDNSSGPDSMPDNSAGMPVDSSQKTVLDNYISVPLDRNSDGLPDIGIQVRQSSTVAIDITRIKYLPLEIGQLSINNRAFTGGTTSRPNVSITYKISKDAQVSTKVFSLDGHLIATLFDNASMTAGTQTIVWDGTSDSGKLQAAGLYVILINASNTGVRISKKVTVFLQAQP